MMSRTGSKGFTLIEVMAATAFLALVSVLIYESYFMSLNTFDYYSNYLNVAAWADEKLWKVQDDLTRLNQLEDGAQSGGFVNLGKKFTWDLSCRAIGKTPQADALYKIDLTLSWQAGKRTVSISRNAYALYQKI